jgi:anti-sigma factor RsiW
MDAIRHRTSRPVVPAGRPSARCLARLEEISAYIDGDLSAARCRALERHLARCPCCAWLQESLRRTSLLCRDADVMMPPAVRAAARKRVRALLARAGHTPCT